MRSAPQRGRQVRAQVVHFAGGCNNACPACTNRDVWLADSREALFRRVDAARDTGRPVLLGGREPTLHPDFIDIKDSLLLLHGPSIGAFRRHRGQTPYISSSTAGARRRRIILRDARFGAISSSS
jgi:hypothetical protein